MQSDQNIQEQILSYDDSQREQSYPNLISNRALQSNNINQTGLQSGLITQGKQQNTNINKGSNLLDEVSEIKYNNGISKLNQIDQTIHQLTGSGYIQQYIPFTKNISHSPQFAEKNYGSSQKVIVEFQHNNIRSEQKKKSFSIFNTIKWKFFANKWLSKTSFSRFKKLNYHHFNLINDKSTIISEGSLPNYEWQKNMKLRIKDQKQSSCQFWRRKQKRIKQNLINEQYQDEEDNLIAESNVYESKFKQLFTEKNLQWCNEWFQWIPVISPSGKFKFMWDIIILSVTIAFLFMIPLAITFNQSLRCMFNDSFIIFCISILIADFFLAWNFGYYEKGLPITKRSQVIINYLKNGILIDVCASIFLLYDILINSSTTSNPFHLLFVIKIKSIKVIFKKIEERFHLTPKIMQISSLIQLLFLILTVSHIFACMWVAVAHEQINHNIKTWMKQIQFDSDDWFSQYICAYYFATVTMITVGYGDFSPVNNTERLVNIASMLISCGVFAYSINAIGDIFSTLNQNSKKIKGDLYTISNFMSKKNINQELQYEVREFLEYQWHMLSNRDQEKENQLIDQLSPQLREKLLAETYKLILYQYKIFQDNFSDEFLISMISIMEEYTFRPEEQISCELNDQECDLYFIESGKVIVYVDENAEKIVKILSKGDHFGELAFFSGQAHSYNIKATEFSSIIRIRRKKFISLIQTYPLDYEIFCCIQDKLLYQKQYSIISTECFSCRSSYHTFKQCPYVHLIVNDVAVINKLNISEHSGRKDVQRNREKYPTLILQQFTQQNIDKHNQDFEEVIESYFEQYIDQNEYVDLYSDISPNLNRTQSNEYVEQRKIEEEIDNDADAKASPIFDSNPPQQQSNIPSQLDDQNNNFSKQLSMSDNNQQQYSRQETRTRKKSKDSKNQPSQNQISSDFETTDQVQKFPRQINRPSILTAKHSGTSSPKQQSNSPTIRVPFNRDKSQPKTHNKNPLQNQVMNNSLIKLNNMYGFSSYAQNNITNSISNFNNQTLHQYMGSSMKVVGDDQSTFNRHNNNISMQNSRQKQMSSMLNNNQNILNQENKIQISDLINQIVNAYAQRDYEGQINNNEEEFDRQKNYDFYLPHNNLTMILEYFKYKQKNIKNMKATLRQSQHHIKSLHQINYTNQNNCKEQQRSLTNANIISNSRDHHLFRKFQQQKQRQIESKQKRQAMLIKKRKSQKTATTKMQKLIFKFEQISNVVPNINTESPLAIQGQYKTTNPDMSIIDHMMEPNRKSSKNYSQQQISHRQSVFSQCNPFQKPYPYEEAKDFHNIEGGLKKIDEFNNKDSNQLKPPNLQKYIQNKIRFSISSNQKSIFSERKSEALDVNHQQLKTLLDLQQRCFKESPKQNYENEDISSSSCCSSDQSPRNKIQDTQKFKYNFSNNQYNSNDISSPQLDQSSIYQLQSQKAHENSTYTFQINQQNHSQSLNYNHEF